MPPRTTAKRQEAAGPTSLDIFACSLIDRGLTTAYDLRRKAGLSVGSTIPALARMERVGLLEKEIATTGDRRRYTYRLSSVGRKLARTGWRSLLLEKNPGDIEDILRVIDMANHYHAPVEQIRAFLERAAQQKNTLANLSAKQKDQTDDGFAYPRAKNEFDTVRLKAESSFLRSWAKQFAHAIRKPHRNRGKVGGRSSQP